MTIARAVAAIEKRGIVLVYPLANKDDPPSLWQTLYPRTPMRWAWDEDADGRVVALWHLRSRLAESKRVVYGKWHGGRATFFSRDVFRALLARLRAGGDLFDGLSPSAVAVLEGLREESPQGTKMLRARADLQGRMMEGAWNRAMRSLWSRLLVVGAGEREEGGFPSLAVGATDVLFEDLAEASAAGPKRGDDALLARTVLASPAFTRTLRRVEKELQAPVAPRVYEGGPGADAFLEGDVYAQKRKA